MRNVISLAAIIITTSITVGSIGCADDGEAGQPGAQGPAGTAGAQGPAGAQGTPAPTTTQTSPPPPAPTPPKAVYVTSNDASANAIVVYARSAADGSITSQRSYLTGGRGAGAGLGNQGALVFDTETNAFLAVNAGDDSISMMAMESDGSLTLLSKVSSGGVRPISIALQGKVVYVLNAGSAASAANISGFHIAGGGALTAIASSTQPLSAAQPGPAQVSFVPGTSTLVVTEKGTNMIDTYTLAANTDVASAPKSQASAGQTPFGFAFAAVGGGKQLIVSEAFGGMAGKGAASSYTIAADGTLTAKTSSIMSAQAAPCWVAVSGTHAFVTNTGSATITTYDVSTDGTLKLANPNGIAAQTGARPSDVDLTDGSDFLYTLNGGDHTISIFAVSAEGALAKKPDLVGVPEFASGLVAR